MRLKAQGRTLHVPVPWYPLPPTLRAAGCALAPFALFTSPPELGRPGSPACWSESRQGCGCGTPIGSDWLRRPSNLRGTRGPGSRGARYPPRSGPSPQPGPFRREASSHRSPDTTPTRCHACRESPRDSAFSGQLGERTFPLGRLRSFHTMRIPLNRSRRRRSNRRRSSPPCKHTPAALGGQGIHVALRQGARL